MSERIDRILKITEVTDIFGVSRPTIYNIIKSGDFPKPIKLTKASVGWLESEIKALIQNKKDERDNS